MTKDERQKIREYAEQAIEDYKEIAKGYIDEKERANYHKGIAKGYSELLDFIMNWME